MPQILFEKNHNDFPKGPHCKNSSPRRTASDSLLKPHSSPRRTASDSPLPLEHTSKKKAPDPSEIALFLKSKSVPDHTYYDSPPLPEQHHLQSHIGKNDVYAPPHRQHSLLNNCARWSRTLDSGASCGRDNRPGPRDRTDRRSRVPAVSAT